MRHIPVNSLESPLLSLLAVSIPGQGITTGTISDTAIDPSGAVVPNAAFTALRTSKGINLAAQPLADGSFSNRLVAIGAYPVPFLFRLPPTGVDNVRARRCND